MKTKPLNDQKKRVLMIFSGFPPLSGSGTQKKLKFVKYLSLFVWQYVILTAKEPVDANYEFECEHVEMII